MFRSIKSRLLLILFAILFSVFGIIVLYFWAEIQNENIEILEYDIYKSEYYIKQTNLARQNFLAYDIKNISFYQREHSIYIDNHRKYLDSLEYYILQLKEVKYIKDHKNHLEDLLTSTQNVHILFDSLSRLTLKKGWKDFGLIGRMQYHTRMIEQFVSNYDQLLFSQLIEKQKSYLLNKDLVSKNELKYKINEFKKSIYVNLTNYKEQQLAIDNINEYNKCFIQISNIDSIIGKNSNYGLLNDIFVAENEVFIEISHIKDSLNTIKSKIKVQRIILFSIIFFIVIALIVVMIVIAILKIGKPVHQVSESIKKYISSDYEEKYKSPEYKSDSEIGELTNNISLLVNNLEDKSQQIYFQKQEIERSFENIKSLSFIGQQIITNLSVEKIVQAVYKNITQLMHVSTFAIGIHNPKMKSLDFWGIKEGGKSVNIGYDKLGDHDKLSVWSFKNQKEIFIADLYAEYHKYIPNLTVPDTKNQLSLIYVPLIAADERIGVITAQSRKKYAYKTYHLNMIKNLAVYISIAIQNAKAFEQIQNQRREILKRNEEMQRQQKEILEINEILEIQKRDLLNALDDIKRLSKIGQEITSNLNLEKITETIHNNIDKFMDATVFGIGLYNEKEKRLEFAKAIEKGVYLPFSYDALDEKDRLSVKCFIDQKDYLISDLFSEYKKYFPNLPKPKAGEIPYSIVYLPITLAEKKIGVITVQSFEKNAYSEKDINILRTLATYIAIAVDNFNTFNKIEIQKQNIEELAQQLKYSFTEIKNSEERLEHIIDFLPDPFMVINKEGKVIAWNKSMEKLTNVKADDIVGKGNYEYALPFYGERRPMLIDLVTKPSEELEQKYTNIKKSGDVVIGQAYVPKLNVYLWGTAGLLYDSDHNITGAIQISRDVTERIHTQKELENANKVLNDQKSEIEKKNIEITEKTTELYELIEELSTTSMIVEEYNKELEKLSIVASKTDNAVLIADNTGEIEWVNEGFTRLYGYTLEQFKRTKGKTFTESSENPEIQTIIKKAISERKSENYITKSITNQGKEIWVQTTFTPIYDENGLLNKQIAIDVDITKIKEAEEKIAKSNKKITYSIQYARRIQTAILPPKRIIERTLAQHFILYKPRDIVSGDFYWITRKQTKIFIAAADCTGHGVPGAFMSILGISFLNEIINKFSEKKNIKDIHASDILDALKINVIKSLHQKGKSNQQKDGMDVALCMFDIDTRMLEYSGANVPIMIVKNNNDEIEYEGNEECLLVFNTNNTHKLIEIKPDKMPIGIYSKKKNKSFTTKKIYLKTNDVLYMASDGYIDQFGGKSGRKFLAKNLRNLLLNIQNESMENQRTILDTTIEDWKNNIKPNGKPYQQIDDILVVGVKF